ncbi:hypothetical protein ACP70R_009347 [Stipagrostis hirtigluma subsp. patula]
MLYNGYDVPSDLKEDLDAMHVSHRTSLSGSTPVAFPTSETFMMESKATSNTTYQDFRICRPGELRGF